MSLFGKLFEAAIAIGSLWWMLKDRDEGKLTQLEEENRSLRQRLSETTRDYLDLQAGRSALGDLYGQRVRNEALARELEFWTNQVQVVEEEEEAPAE